MAKEAAAEIAELREKVEVANLRAELAEAQMRIAEAQLRRRKALDEMRGEA